jgi:hypothetical protein
MGTFSVFYNGQFWVGVAERERDGALEIARVVFGPSEPRDFELVTWARDCFHLLGFRGVDIAAEPMTSVARNPKRRQREAARALATPPLSTRAQAALAAAQALAAGERKQAARRHGEAERERAFHHRQARKKKRKRGH